MVEILGPDGRPVTRQRAEREEQTARLSGLHREIGDHPTRGLTPDRLAKILRDAEQGDLRAQADLGEDMWEKDTHIFAELSKRRHAIGAMEWSIEAPEDASAEEQRVAELAAEVVGCLDAQDLLLELSTAILHGYAGIEYAWRRVDGVWMPDSPQLRPASWFFTTQDDRDTLLLRNHGAGEPLRPFNWTLHKHKSKSGYITRAGLARVLAWPFLFRALPARDWAEFLEIYGLPIRLGKYPPNASANEKNTLLRAVTQIGHHAAGIMPQGMEIEMQRAVEARGGADPFQKMIEWAEGAISKAILGGTLTTSAESTGLGSNLGETQNEVRTEIRDSDIRQIRRTLETQLLAQIVALNARGEVRPPRWVWQLDDHEDLGAFSEALPKLVGVGLRVPEAWARERLRIPEPEGDEPVLSAPQPQSPAPPVGPAALRRAAARLERSESGGTRLESPVAPLTDLTAEAAADPLRQWLEQIRAMADEAESLEALRDRLLEAYGDLEATDMRAVMRLALATAEASGRFDVAEESDAVPDSG